MNEETNLYDSSFIPFAKIIYIFGNANVCANVFCFFTKRFSNFVILKTDK
jgi:hypothetical protein